MQVVDPRQLWYMFHATDSHGVKLKPAEVEPGNMDGFHLLSYFQTDTEYGNNLLPAIFRVGATQPITAAVEKETETGLWWLDIKVVVC